MSLRTESFISNKKLGHSIKEEVASVLLSALMGYIIESWESEPLKQLPEPGEQRTSNDLQISIIATDSISESRNYLLEKKDNFSEIESNISRRKSRDSRRQSKFSRLTDRRSIKKRKSTDLKRQSRISRPRVTGEVNESKDLSNMNIPTDYSKNTIPTLEIRQHPFDEVSSQEGVQMYQKERRELLDKSQHLEDASHQSLRSLQTEMSSKSSESDDLVFKLLFDWRFLESDSLVKINFKQGNTYQGPLSRCRMHYKGQFTWADGSTYVGDFNKGELTGNGILTWSDQNWYEGGFYKGFRHGHGLLVLNNYVCYIGNWFFGQKHGLGHLNYNDPQKQHDYYYGEWNLGCREGTGLRHYPSGARYSGHWRNNCRHGLGTMVWTNNDVYSGNWDNGEIDGYGDYTWQTFYNKQLVLPQENSYCGMWKKGIRHGNGTLELASGAVIRGCWWDGLKHGPAEVVCSNGTFICVDDLFSHDCVLPITDTTGTMSLYHVPINSPCQDVNLTVYTHRLKSYKEYCDEMRINNKVFEQYKFCKENQNSYSNISIVVDEANEEKWLRNVILSHLIILKAIYKMYAELGCNSKVNFKSVMTRIMLWQLWRDCGFHQRGLSLAEIDLIIASNSCTLMESAHYPFERIQFWQFLHCLIELSWQFYILGKQSLTSNIPGVLGAALDILITKDIEANVNQHQGIALFMYRDFLSIDAVYWLYKRFGKKPTARQFIKSIMIADNSKQSQIPFYPSYALQGTNAFGVGGKLIYLQGEEPMINTEMLAASMREPLYSEPLSSLRDIGKKRAVKNLLSICPSIRVDRLYVNIDYELVFLEFYELLLLCAISSIKKVMWIQRKCEEVEKERLEKIEEEIRIKALEEQLKLKKAKSEDKKKTPKSRKKQTA